MKSFILSQTDFLVFPLIAVVMFFAVFTGVLLWIYRPGSREVHAQRSRLVFDREEERQ